MTPVATTRRHFLPYSTLREPSSRERERLTANGNAYPSGTAPPNSEQVGVRPWRCRRLAAQRSALGTRATHWLPHTQV
ncbi:hypothetical protein [Calothrix sp. NIES-2098]|uniref:hypothetical protein n=1 Tax=Calothrix sp. NIES-2098 TaxID=1954171 RepID=UPI0030D9378C